MMLLLAAKLFVVVGIRRDSKLVLTRLKLVANIILLLILFINIILIPSVFCYMIWYLFLFFSVRLLRQSYLVPVSLERLPILNIVAIKRATASVYVVALLK